MDGDSAELAEMLAVIEGRYGGGASVEERVARVRARLAEARAIEADVEFQGQILDDWSRGLFIALCSRYGLKPYRHPRQRRTTAIVKAPPSFVEQVVQPAFRALQGEMGRRVNAITGEWIREAVFAGEDG